MNGARLQCHPDQTALVVRTLASEVAGFAFCAISAVPADARPGLNRYVGFADAPPAVEARLYRLVLSGAGVCLARRATWQPLTPRGLRGCSSHLTRAAYGRSQALVPSPRRVPVWDLACWVTRRLGVCWYPGLAVRGAAPAILLQAREAQPPVQPETSWQLPGRSKPGTGASKIHPKFCRTSDFQRHVR